MGEVVSMQPKVQLGENCFAACQCGESFIPLLIMAERPFVAALVCPSCEIEVPVDGGYIGEPVK